MYPHERSLVRRLADKPFAIIGVNSDRDLESIRKVTKEKSITWRSFWNGEEGTRGPISTKWCVTGWPTTYLIDKDGVIRYKNVRGKSLDEALEVLMKEMGETVELVGIDHEAEDEAALAAAEEEAEVSTEAKPDSDAKDKGEAAESEAETSKEAQPAGSAANKDAKETTDEKSTDEGSAKEESSENESGNAKSSSDVEEKNTEKSDG